MVPLSVMVPVVIMMNDSNPTTIGQVNCVKINAEARAMYSSDDTDDLLGSIITNTRQAKKVEKPKGAVDQLVEEAYNKAMKDYKTDKV